MGKIRSALEIALERTETIQSDKESIGLFEVKQQGKKIANTYLEGNLPSLEGELEKTAPSDRVHLKQGIFDVLLSQITLPVHKDDLIRLERAGTGLHLVIGEKRFKAMAGELVQMMQQYLNEAAQYEDAIVQQYAPKLRQKEEEIARRLGRQIKLDPFQDPEFVAFFNQNMNALKANYHAVIDQVKNEALGLFKGEGNG